MKWIFKQTVLLLLMIPFASSQVTFKEMADDWELNAEALFGNNGDSTFIDISSNTNEDGFDYGQSASAADIGNDGNFDLYLCSGFGTNSMWENYGKRYLRNITEHSNTGVGAYSGSAFKNIIQKTLKKLTFSLTTGVSNF